MTAVPPSSPASTAGHPVSPGPVVPVGHAAAVVESEAGLLGTALTFLEEGLRAGDLTVLSCSRETLELLRSQLGPRAATARYEPGISLLGARGPEALATCRRYQERATASGAGRLRVFTEVDFGSDPADWREGRRFESAANRFLPRAASSVLCLYDRRRVPAAVADSAAATHPLLVRDGVWADNPAFQRPSVYVGSLPAFREPVEDTEPVLAVDDAPTLAGLRAQLRAVLAAQVPDPDQREDLYLAASEIAANAFRHGARPVSARIWADSVRLVCAITDRGTAYVDPLAGFVPAHGDDLGRGGMGLWLARKLWDHVDPVRGPAGFTIRLGTRLR